MPSEAQVTLTTDAPAPLKVYSQGVRAGDLYYTSGSVGMRADGSMVEGTVQDRTKQVIANLEAVLKAAGLGLKDVIKANIYLSKIGEDFHKVNETYLSLMPEPKPARTCIGVYELPLKTDVEIEFVAYFPKSE